MPNVDSHILGEAQRIELLEYLHLMEADDTEAFDRLTRWAARMLDVPISLVTTVTQDTEIVLGQTGLIEPFRTSRKMPLDLSICQHVVAKNQPLIVTNAPEDPLINDNLAVTDKQVTAYLGIPITSANGIALGSFCVMTDYPREWTEDDIFLMQELTQTVMTEIELRTELRARQQAQHSLAQSVREREQLRIAKEMTQSVAHDIKTPLSSIGIKADLLKRTIHDDKSRERLDSIQAQVTRISDILNEFSEFWATDRVRYTFVESDIHQIIEASIALVLNDELFKEDVSRLLYQLDATQYQFRLEPNLVQIIIQNILENAFIYSDEGAIYLHTYNEKDQFVLTISDNGIGITEQDIPLIFNPMYKVNHARTSNHSRSGLGLTLVRNAVDIHQGTIEVESVLDEGTTFRVYLPMQ